MVSGNQLFVSSEKETFVFLPSPSIPRNSLDSYRKTKIEIKASGYCLAHNLTLRFFKKNKLLLFYCCSYSNSHDYVFILTEELPQNKIPGKESSSKRVVQFT